MPKCRWLQLGVSLGKRDSVLDWMPIVVEWRLAIPSGPAQRRTRFGKARPSPERIGRLGRVLGVGFAPPAARSTARQRRLGQAIKPTSLLPIRRC